jgi:Concanavalin A-like lectin/glucanases superfamily
MSTTLFFLLPIGMLAVVWSVCFVGCVFQTGGLAQPYSNNILAEASLVAYWPLSDFPNSQPPAGAPALPPPPQGSTSAGIALDISGKNHNGTYIIPPIYQSGTTFLTTMGNPPVDLKPTLNLHQPSIVPGDAIASGSKNLPACVDFEGGFVSIPWAANSQPLTEFTLEAWVKPKWTATGFNWVVFAARTSTATGTGFALSINGQNQWELAVGNGTAFTTINTMVPAALNGAVTYVAMTFKSATQVLSLWINPQSDSDSNNPPPPTAAWPPDPTTITPYVAIDPTQPLTFFIGAGDNQNAQTPRTQDGGPGAPLVPFQGLIQSVALYNTALDPTDLASHFSNGAETG